jgi:hydrogenase maturation protease
MSEQSYEILVLGIGHLLMADDGLGVLAVEGLRKKTWPRDVRILEAGVSAMLFLEEISRSQNVIIVDAVRMGGVPGSIYRLHFRDIPCVGDGWRDAHGFSPVTAIEMARELTGLPFNTVIYGVEPCAIEPGIGLSPAVASSLQTVMDRVEEEIERILRNYRISKI